MKFYKRADIALNVMSPIVLGFLLYLFRSATMPALISNHLADGLWAYAFISSILIIWDRNISTTWILTTFITAIGFESLQYIHQIPGTGDICDVITYFIFFTIALKLNHFFKTILQTKISNYDTY